MQDRYYEGKKKPHVSKIITSAVYKTFEMSRKECNFNDGDSGLEEDTEPVSTSIYFHCPGGLRSPLFAHLLNLGYFWLILMINVCLHSCFLAAGACEWPTMDGRTPLSQAERSGTISTLYNRVDVEYRTAFAQVIKAPHKFEAKNEHFVPLKQIAAASGLFDQDSRRGVTAVV